MSRRGETRVELEFPVGGQNRRLDFQRQPPYTTYSSENVFPDNSITQRESGGSRPGLSKLYALQLGSGNPVRMLSAVRAVISGTQQTLRVASSNGLLYKNTPSNWTLVSTSTTLASDRQLMAVDFFGKLYIADYGANVESGSDGVMASGNFTSSTAGSFAASGCNTLDHLLAITSHAAIDAFWEITLTGTPTGGLVEFIKGPGETALWAFDATVGTVEAALEVLYGDGNVSVGGSAGDWEITFAGDLADTLVSSETVAVSGYQLTGGSSPDATLTITEAGASSTQYAGTYQIASVVTTTLTLVHSLRNLTGIVFYVARGPKVYDPVANTLTLWVQENDTDGNPKGAIPVGRSIIEEFNHRLYLAGGINSPQTFACCRQGEALDWDASQEDAGRAVSGSIIGTAQIAEPITAMIRHQNSCMIFACLGSLWVLRGDVTAGGIINLSRHVGIIDKKAWCVTPEGIMFFLSRDGVYAMNDACGGQPYSVSRERMPTELVNVDLSTTTPIMECCPFFRMIQLHLTVSAAAATGWLIDYKRSDEGDQVGAAFFKYLTGSANHGVFSIHALRDSNLATSSVMLGCADGYVRVFDAATSTDDGTAFSSTVHIGPVMLGRGGFERGIVNEVRAVIPSNSGDVDVAVYVGNSAETALTATPVSLQFNSTGHAPSQYVRRGGQAAWFVVTNGETGAEWGLSRILVTVLPSGGIKV
jgi:hypothetical protein